MFKNFYGLITIFRIITIYNTINALTKKGHLKEINVGSDMSYFDTNTHSHHHFYDNETSELIDISENQIKFEKIPNAPNGKKIVNVEVIINLKDCDCIP